MWKNYRPLMVVIALCLLTAGAISLPHGNFLTNFMGMFFVVFSLFKLIDLPGFITGLKKYDFVARRLTFYAPVFPFIELGLGLGYLAFGSTLPLNIATVFFTLVNTYSVTRALRKGLDVRCACLGTALDVPLSTVTIIENIFMAAMALLMIIFRGV